MSLLLRNLAAKPSASSLFPANFKFKELGGRYIVILCVAILLFGGALRAAQYAANRSLWLDEAMLALNIVNRSFFELAQLPLEYDQAAPLGFLLGEKLLTTLFGKADYVLRILPLLCGLASLWAMYALAKRVLAQRIAIVAAVLLFAVSAPLIYYASEVKQYSCDVLICLLLLVAIIRNFDRDLFHQDFLLLAVLGAAALPSSYPALFVLASGGFALATHFIVKRDWWSGVKLGSNAAVWLVSFVLLYSVSWREVSGNSSLSEYWQITFMPLPPWRDWRWFIDTLRSFMGFPLDLPAKTTAALLALGSVSICVRRWQLGLTLLLPILLTLVASALQKYPFWGRLLLFLTPITSLLLAEAIGRMQWLFNRLTGVPWAGLPIAAALLAWVAITPASHGAQYLWKPRLVEEMKPIMSYLSEHRRPNDAVYVYYAAVPAFRYYLPFYNLTEVHVLWGTTNREHPAEYLLELDKLRGRGRVWIVFSHNFSGNATDEKTLFLDYLDEIGKRSEKFNTDGAWLALYDL